MKLGKLPACIVILAFAVVAHADPSDSDDFYRVGIGSTIHITQSINIPPYADTIILGSLAKGNQFDSENYNRGTRKMVCKLNLAEAKPFDRILDAGTRLEVTETFQGSKYLRTDTTRGWFKNGTSYGEWYTRIFQKTDRVITNNLAIKSIECANSNGDTRTDLQSTSIGDFKMMTSGKLELKLAVPQNL